MIQERALTEGGFTARELGAPAPEGAVKYARLVDHELSWALTNLKRDGLVENPRWSTWRLAGAACATVAPIGDAPVDQERLAELRSMPYRLYLRTPEWRRTRAAALLRAGDRCSLDATHVEDLEVHHSSYERRGEELESDLTVLCRSCHERVHENNRLAGRQHRRLWFPLVRWWSREARLTGD